MFKRILQYIAQYYKAVSIFKRTVSKIQNSKISFEHTNCREVFMKNTGYLYSMTSAPGVGDRNFWEKVPRRQLQNFFKLLATNYFSLAYFL